jgi:hypothetical protein
MIDICCIFFLFRKNLDHLPISITFVDDAPPPRTARSFVNFKKAKWGLWTSETEAKFSGLPLPTKCSPGEKVFRKVLNNASKHHIPEGFRKDFKPGLSTEVVDLSKECNRLHEVNHLDPEIPMLNNLISETISSESKQAWNDTVESCHPRANLEKH